LEIRSGRDVRACSFWLVVLFAQALCCVHDDTVDALCVGLGEYSRRVPGRRVASGCGDGVQGPTEECDDGNFVNHDGCSSACKQETAHWTAVMSGWNPRYEHGAACGDTAAGTCGSKGSAMTVLYEFGGIVPDGFSNELWSHTSATIRIARSRRSRAREAQK
jgi:cysteine-rich repeat protein